MQTKVDDVPSRREICLRGETFSRLNPACVYAMLQFICATKSAAPPPDTS